MNKVRDFQKKRTVLVEVTAANQGTGNEAIVDVPGGSFVTVRAHKVSAFDGTTPTLTVSDGTNTYISANDLLATGSVAGSTGFVDTNATVSVSVGGSGSTTGLAYVEVEYSNTGMSDGVYTHEG